jgi:hypothetical protein
MVFKDKQAQQKTAEVVLASFQPTLPYQVD